MNTIPASEFRERQRRAQQRVAEAGLDAAIVHSNEADFAGAREWSMTVRIPLRRLRPNGSTERPLRVEVERRAALPEGRATYSWREQPPLEARLAHGSANPADLGWLLLG